MCHGPFSLMDPVLPGEGRWLTGGASARASEEAGAIGPVKDSSNNFSTEAEVFFSAGRLHAFIVVAVFSLADVLFICGRVHERHQFNCGSTSNFCS